MKRVGIERGAACSSKIHAGSKNHMIEDWGPAYVYQGCSGFRNMENGFDTPYSKTRETG
jgi:hypothetical protein